MIISRRSKFRLCGFIFLLVQVLALDLRAQGISDPLRLKTPEYSRFLITQLDSWYAKNIFDVVKVQTKEDRAYHATFLRKNGQLGLMSGATFFRSVDYSARFLDASLKFYRVHLIDFKNDAELRVLAEKAAASHKMKLVELGIKTQALGLGWTSDGETILSAYEPAFESTSLKQIPEKLKSGQSGARLVSYVFRSAKLERVEIMKAGLETEHNAPVVVGHSQVDEIKLANEKIELQFHPYRFEGRAVGGAAEVFVQKIRRGLNMAPGAVSWSSAKDFEIRFP